MPVVLRSAGFTVSILLPPREHGPPHAHVRRRHEEVAVFLTPVTVKKVTGMRDVDVVKAVRLVEANAEFLLEQWRVHHDT